jgi:hypothetical protein
MRGILSSALLALPIATASPAQNLLVNPDFDDDLLGWESDVEWIAGSHDDEDYAGDPESGSARVVNSRDTLGIGGIVQCVTVPEQDGTVQHEASVWVRVDDGQSVDGHARLGLWYFSNQTCDLQNGLLSQVDPSYGVEFWGESRHQLIYPAGTRSVRFDLRVDKFVEGGDAAALFDHAYLPEPGPFEASLLAALTLYGVGARTASTTSSGCSIGIRWPLATRRISARSAAPKVRS